MCEFGIACKSKLNTIRTHFGFSGFDTVFVICCLVFSPLSAQPPEKDVEFIEGSGPSDRGSMNILTGSPGAKCCLTKTFVCIAPDGGAHQTRTRSTNDPVTAAFSPQTVVSH
jgi:hypothetical protein